MTEIQIDFRTFEFGILKLFRIGPFGTLRPDFACLRRSGYAQAGASDLTLVGQRVIRKMSGQDLGKIEGWTGYW